MKWQGRKGSRNIEDRRRSVRATTWGIGGGIGGIGAVVLVLAGLYFGVDVTPFLAANDPRPMTAAEKGAATDRAAQFVGVVLADTETVWREVFRTELGETYHPPVLVLFSGGTSSPCGGASGASGPFYCPADRKAYLDTDFFALLADRFGARGDFASAYVVAHEVAHHVQNELGILSRANRARDGASQAQRNAISVRIELQADCLSGIWARYAQDRLGTLEPGDIEEAMNAARQIGDDMLQRAAGQPPMPHTFTHGTSEQRQRWFARGYGTPRLVQCDTFGADAL